ncbi:MAG: type II secretion system protein [Sedimentisphaerales bacterium]|nr:type II secretion system protein [Sedimentisphaerales bacterium]
MRKAKGFTLIELLVVIAIIALLMSILMPALTRVKKQARTVACLGLLKQWSLFFSMYTDAYDGSFMRGFTANPANRWVSAMGEYHKWDSELTCCPNATKPWQDEYGNPTGLEGTFRGSTSAWGWYDRSNWLKPMKGSFGINTYCMDVPDGSEPHSRPKGDFWRKAGGSRASYVPLFLGALRYNGVPLHTDFPPPADGTQWNDDAQMGRYCMNRHDGFNNTLFMDYSARKVGLKELWTLKWHRSYLESGPWTKAGGVMPGDWPDWLRPFREY